jgi:D-xylose 1-dehydrogenase (NADP+, D-xylono-1,5-lactone-forming)
VNEVRWGVLSTARISSLVVQASRRSRLARFVAVASRSDAAARRFADEHDLDARYGSYEQLLGSDSVDAVYVSLPNTLHTEWTIRALEAGKHVLCEKPFAVRPEDAASAFDIAERAGLVCVEGLMYRHHPQTMLVQRLLEEGAIGALKHVRAALTARIGKDDIRRDRALGGGALTDLGCYCASAARLFAGTPGRVFAEAVRESTGIDMHLAATMRHPRDVITQFDIGFDLPRRDELELIGNEGTIVVTDPWLCRRETIELRHDGRSESRAVDPEGRFALAHDDHDVYRIELDTVSEAIAGGAQLPFGRTDAIDQARLLEALSDSSLRMESVAM